MILSLRSRLIQIHSCRGVGWKTLQAFIKFDPTLESIFMLRQQHFQTLFNIKSSNGEVLYNDLRKMKNLLDYYRKEEINCITIYDRDYPTLLKQIYDPPWVLYCKGDPSLLNRKIISIVGTRDLSVNGLASIEKIVPPLINENWIIASGLAVGADAKAHTTAINNNGKTIAVIGSGFHHIYPKCHQKLASLISQHHLLISEYPPYQRPQKWQFPMRNRIISGLAKGTVVVEARKKSGSLITAELAIEQGREVFAVPGSILDDRTEGPHQLIQEGAILIKCGKDILGEFK